MDDEYTRLFTRKMHTIDVKYCDDVNFIVFLYNI